VGFAMEEPSLQDSREDLFYTTSTADYLEYTPYEVGARVRTSLLDRFFDYSYNIYKKITRLFLLSLISASHTSLDLLKFLGVYSLYAKTKTVGFFIFLEASKDKIVRTLMWRRGLLFRPATHGGVVAIVVVAVAAGGLFSKSEIAAQDLTLTESALRSPRNTLYLSTALDGRTIFPILIKSRQATL
jgi:hypothetical protein